MKDEMTKQKNRTEKVVLGNSVETLAEWATCGQLDPTGCCGSGANNSFATLLSGCYNREQN